MPSIDYLNLSRLNCFDFNILYDLIKCFTLIFFFNFQFMCVKFLWQFIYDLHVLDDFDDFFSDYLTIRYIIYTTATVVIQICFVWWIVAEGGLIIFSQKQLVFLNTC